CYAPASWWVEFSTFSPWNAIVVFAGHHIFSIDITVMPNGSGDTTWNYVQLAVIGSISLLATVVWTAIDRKRADYDKLLFWFLIFLRYFLAYMMFAYGLAKVIKTQFPFPTLERLTAPLGQLSPMGLLWAFMGYSKTYNLFAGGAEMLAGALLFFRRTTLLGALITIFIMVNILMLNLSYDVPVKLFSAHLLVVAVVIAAPQFKRLISFFILNKATAPENIRPVFTHPKARLFYGIGKAIVILVIVGPLIVVGLKRGDEVAARFPERFDSYEIVEHKTNGIVVPEDDKTRRWKKLYVMPNDQCSLQYMDGARIGWKFTSDTVARTMSLISPDSGTVYHFRYAITSDNLYRLKGKLNEDSIQIAMRKNPDEFILITRGFHWINEYPYSR
ncbi:MAG TPA: DoxX family protein, partial [Chryseolinea sp.]